MKLILIALVGLVVGLMVACGEKAPPTPAGPAYTKAEAMAVLKEHLQSKMFPGEPYPCLLVVDEHASNPSNYWVASYDTDGSLWNITIKSQAPKQPKQPKQPQQPQQPEQPEQPEQPGTKYYTWSVYERTGSIVATGDDPLNQMC